MRISVFTYTDEIMQQEIRPLVAVDIIEQLHRQFAILSGKKLLIIHTPGFSWKCVGIHHVDCHPSALYSSWNSIFILLMKIAVTIRHSQCMELENANSLCLFFLKQVNFPCPPQQSGGTDLKGKKLSKSFCIYLCMMSKHFVCGKRCWSIGKLFMTFPLFLICLCFRNDSFVNCKVLMFSDLIITMFLHGFLDLAITQSDAISAPDK